MASFYHVLAFIKEGKRVELKFRLNAFVFSRHELSWANGKIQDFSYVDDSTTNYTIKQYQRSFYGKMFNRKRVKIEEIYEPN